jgi:hypothetical protein
MRRPARRQSPLCRRRGRRRAASRPEPGSRGCRAAAAVQRRAQERRQGSTHRAPGSSASKQCGRSRRVFGRLWDAGFQTSASGLPAPSLSLGTQTLGPSDEMERPPSESDEVGRRTTLTGDPRAGPRAIEVRFVMPLPVVESPCRPHSRHGICARIRASRRPERLRRAGRLLTLSSPHATVGGPEPRPARGSAR